ncbi:protein of unknown function [Aminobacter niigataensis]|nr:protein of unknown function [Aminobacter niigataensis]
MTGCGSTTNVPNVHAKSRYPISVWQKSHDLRGRIRTLLILGAPKARNNTTGALREKAAVGMILL